MEFDTWVHQVTIGYGIMLTLYFTFTKIVIPREVEPEFLRKYMVAQFRRIEKVTSTSAAAVAGPGSGGAGAAAGKMTGPRLVPTKGMHIARGYHTARTLGNVFSRLARR